MRFGFLNHVVNPLVRAVLCSPMHRLLSGRLLLLTYVGHLSGETHRIPVAYRPLPDGKLEVRVGAPERKVWWRSLRSTASVELRLRGERVGATATAHTRGDEVRVEIERFSGDR